MNNLAGLSSKLGEITKNIDTSKLEGVGKSLTENLPNIEGLDTSKIGDIAKNFNPSNLLKGATETRI
jgi:hypothetical protein